MSGLILTWDTETTGFVKDRLPPSDPMQPHLVELAASLIEEDGTERASMAMIVKPEGYAIPTAASKIHGIDTALATRVGFPLRVVIAVFTNMRALADEVVAHNETFDWLVIEAQIARLGIKTKAGWPKRTCTMRGATDLMALPPTERMIAAGFDKFKPPNLTELHTFLFNEGFAGAHGALADVRACTRCFVELRQRGVL